MKSISKFFIIPICILALFVGFALNAKAVINSQYEIQYKIEKLKELSSFDYISLINKNDLIGYRLEGFNMSCRYYMNNVIATTNVLENIIKQLDIVNNSTDYSNTEKTMQTSKLYQDANTALNDLDIKTMNYLIEIRNYMPTMTYQRYLKKFQEYYNDLGLSGSIVDVK